MKYTTKNPVEIDAFEITRVFQCYENGMPSGIWAVMGASEQWTFAHNLTKPPVVGDYFVLTLDHFPQQLVSKDEFFAYVVDPTSQPDTVAEAPQE